LALDRLISLGQPAGNASILYLVLIAAHDHQPGKQFAIVVDAMVSAGLLPYRKSTAQTAKEALLEAGLIVRVRKGAFKEPDLYQLVPGSMLLTHPL
jgi:hypothetical protein